MADQQISESPGTGELSFAITPSTQSTTAKAPRGELDVGASGDVVLVNGDGSTTCRASCPAGLVIPCWSIWVNATVGGTRTASNLVGIT